MIKSISYSMLLVFCWGNSWSQTVNTGIMVVQEGTIFSTMDHFINEEQGDLVNDGEFIVYKDFHNDGVLTFTQGADGLIRFDGFSDPQVISGSEPFEMNRIYFNNSNQPQPAFHLYGELHVYGEVGFYSGILDNRNFGGAIRFMSSSYHTNTSDSSFVDGVAEKEGTESFRFPVGHQLHYRPLTMTAPQGISRLFSEYYLENSNDLYPHSQRASGIEYINEKEYWEFNRLQSPEVRDVLVTLSFDPVTTSEVILESLESVHVVRWDSDNGQWVDEGGLVSVSDQEVTTISEIGGYGIFTLAVVKDEQSDEELDIYNAVTPNNDGLNDYFFIGNIDRFPNNKVSIYSRYGVKVYETENYDSNGNVFRGEAARGVVLDSGLLPSGTYFYVIEYNRQNSNENRRQRKAGYLYLNHD